MSKLLVEKKRLHKKGLISIGNWLENGTGRFAFLCQHK